MPKWPFGDIGPCLVVWDYGGNPVNLYPYLGTITLRIADSVENVEEEGWGSTAVDAVFSGTECQLDVPLTRQDFDDLVNWVPGLTQSGSNYIFAPKAGCSMYDDAKEMVIKPLCDNQPESDTSKWIHIFKAYPWRDVELGFDRSGQRVFLVHFKLFPDLTSGAGGRVFSVGLVT